MNDHILRTQDKEIRSLKDNLRVAKQTSDQLRDLIATLNADRERLRQMAIEATGLASLAMRNPGALPDTAGENLDALIKALQLGN